MNFVTYNIQLLPWMKKQYNIFSKFIKKYDIIFIQEAFFSFYPKHGKLKILSILNKYNFAYSPMPHYKVDGGLIIASRYPIIYRKFIPFTCSESVDRLSEKGFLHCIINSPLGYIHCINTHMQSAYLDDEWPYTGHHLETRVKQLKQLIEFVVTVHGKIIIGGDFNVVNDTEENAVKEIFKKLNIDNIIFNKFDCILSNLKLFHCNERESIAEWSDHEPLSCKVQY
jgi:hypothetical protein